MNWITFCCVAVFLICQYSVGHGEGENVGESIALTPEKFYSKYYDLLAPGIQYTLACDDMEFIYLQGAKDHVCIHLRPSLLVFCLLDLMHQYSLIYDVEVSKISLKAINESL